MPPQRSVPLKEAAHVGIQTRRCDQPESVETRGDLVLFTFAIGERAQPTHVTFNVRPDEYWSQDARAGIEGGGSVSFRQFIYP
jgi:hypothetical protein